MILQYHSTYTQIADISGNAQHFQAVPSMLPAGFRVRVGERVAQRGLHGGEAIRALRRRHRAGDRVPQGTLHI